MSSIQTVWLNRKVEISVQAKLQTILSKLGVLCTRDFETNGTLRLVQDI